MFLALDLATKTGCAVWDPEWDKPRSMTFDLPPGTKEDSRIGAAGLSLHQNLHRVHTNIGKITRLYFEEPLVPSGMEGEITMRTIGRTIGLAAHAESYAAAIGISAHCYVVHQSTWRKIFLGRGAGWKTRDGERIDPKKLCRERCEELGWHPRNNDEADALGVLYYGVHVSRMLPESWSTGIVFGGGR